MNETDPDYADDARISVAQVAQEVAADLGDYVKDDYGFRTADAQEMIERAFAGLEPKPVSADVEQIAREVVERILNHSDSRQQCEQTVANAITAALAPSEKLIEELECKDTNHRVEITRLQAELEQVRVTYIETIADLRARLATAEADTKRLDWLESERKGGRFHIATGDYGVTLQSARHVNTGSQSIREAIDKAKGGA